MRQLCRRFFFFFGFFLFLLMLMRNCETSLVLFADTKKKCKITDTGGTALFNRGQWLPIVATQYQSTQASGFYRNVYIYGNIYICLCVFVFVCVCVFQNVFFSPQIRTHKKKRGNVSPNKATNDATNQQTNNVKSNK